MRIGQLITSSLQAMTNQTMTSTIFSPYVDRVMEESRIAYFSGSLGETLDTNRGEGYDRMGKRASTLSARGGVLSGRGGVWRGLNDLLPFNLRPIKSIRRTHKGMGVGWAAELYYWRRRWHSHGKYAVRTTANKMKFWKR